MSILATAYYSKKATFEQSIHAILFLLKWLKHPGLKVGEKSGEIEQKPSLVSNTNFTLLSYFWTDTCPAGFLIHGKSCYYVANTSSASTWNKSRIFCQNLGADLAVIKSEEENQFVYDLLRNTKRRPVMDGLGCIGKLIKNFIGLIAAL